MSDWYSDNDDLRFYVEKWIDWQALYPVVEFGPTAECPYADADEAVAVWTDILKLAGEFAAQNIAPAAAEIDRDPMELVDGEVRFSPPLARIFDEIGAMGLHGLCVPRELGGMNAPLLVYQMVGEIFARADVSVMAHHSFHGGMAMAMLMYSALEGSSKISPEGHIEDTRFRAAIEEIAQGQAWGSMDITEPDAGSDMGAMRCRGTLHEDGRWTVDGQKIFITSGHGKYHFVIARTDEPDPENTLTGLSLFLVNSYRADGSRQVEVERLEEKLGHHASATVALRYDNAEAELIGERGQGFRQMLLLMNNARISVGFESLGVMESAFRMARDYAAGRPSMGRTIDKHEMIADLLDEMESDIHGIRALAMSAALAEERAQRLRLKVRYLAQSETEREALQREVKRLTWGARRITPLIKFLAAEKAVEIARRCLQIHGGYGYMTEYGAEKLLRDALVLPIYEGTSQIQALMATKDNLLWITKQPAAFARSLVTTRWKRLTDDDPLARRVAGIRLNCLLAQQSLMRRIVGDKLKGPVATWAAAFKSWDPRQDFGPALLHAEKLTRMLADAAICEEVLAQAKQHPERRRLLQRLLERAEPRGRDLLYRIQTGGHRLLQQLAHDRAVAESADERVA